MVEVRTAKQLDDLKELLTSGGDVSIAVAYVSKKGLELIRKELRDALSNSKVRVLIALDGRITEPAAVQELVDLKADGLEARYFDIPKSESAIYHPKLYISKSEESTVFLTGSYNLTGAALIRNQEHGLRVSCSNDEKPSQEALDIFTGLWDDSKERAKPLTQAVADRYELECNKNGYTLPSEELADFEWPSASSEVAFLMGAICARGKLYKDVHRIEISLQFKKKGKDIVRNAEYDRAEKYTQVPKYIKRMAKSALPGVEISIEGQKVTVDCSSSHETFDKIFRAYKRKLGVVTQRYEYFVPMCLPTYATRESIRKPFLQGYAVASGWISEKTKLPRAYNPQQPYVVWLRPYQSNTEMFEALQILIKRLIKRKPESSWVISQREGKTSYCVAILAEDFMDTVGNFGIEKWNDLVNAATEANIDMRLQSHQRTIGF